MSLQAIPTISANDLLSGERWRQSAADQAIAMAARDTGFLLLGDLPAWAHLDAVQRQSLLRIFSLPEAALKRLWLRKFEASQPNIYRGWFPLQNGFPTYKEGIDIGPDLVWPELALAHSDPLLEPSPLPTEQELPGWRVAAAQYYQAMHRLSTAIMQCLARGLGLPEHSFDAAFVQGISTLRFIRYPVRSPRSLDAVGGEEMWAEHSGQRYYLTRPAGGQRRAGGAGDGAPRVGFGARAFFHSVLLRAARRCSHRATGLTGRRDFRTLFLRRPFVGNHHNPERRISRHRPFAPAYGVTKCASQIAMPKRG